jgi:sec-independent protein translocase protein TatA
MLLGFLSPSEIAIIVVVILLVFGPSKLPQLGSSIGKMLRGFKKEMKSMEKDEDDEATLPAKQGEIDVTPAEKKSAG